LATKRIREKYNLSKVNNSAYNTTNKRRRISNTWFPNVGNSDKDDLTSLEDIRLQSRDLSRNSAIGRAIIDEFPLNAVGTGLKLKSTPDYRILGISKEEAEALGKDIDFRFNEVWGKSKNCDQQGTKTFNQIQLLAITSCLTSGDVFTIPNIEKNKLRLQLIEADRVSTPTNKIDYLNPLEKVASGVEISKKGEIKAYYVSKYHPYGITTLSNEWTRISAKVDDLGLRKIIHTYMERRPGQRRGMPLLTPVIETLKKLSDLTDAELEASIVTSMFAVFITSESGEGLEQINTNGLNGEPMPDNLDGLGLYPGTIAQLKEGESIQTANPNRPNDLFEPFHNALLKHIGSAIGIPYEVLLKHFSSSYSASRGAILEAWKRIKTIRQWFVEDFCNPVYEQWLILDILEGNIKAPNFFDSEIIRRAYLKSEWMGMQQPQIDPLKETNASILKAQNGLSTYTKEASEMNGTDFTQNATTLKSENELLSEANQVLMPIDENIEDENIDENEDETN
jgi:lambda family phage portal protein